MPNLSCWRIAKTRHATTVEEMLSGEGARTTGGRWNEPGVPLVYTSDSAALATLETLVHLNRPSILSSYSMIRFELASDLVLLPGNDEATVFTEVLQDMGDRLARAMITTDTLAVGVPSVVVPSGLNILINPGATRFEPRNVELAPYTLDHRLAP